jgi:hypothetical protein
VGGEKIVARGLPGAVGGRLGPGSIDREVAQRLELATLQGSKAMASNTKATTVKRKNKHEAAGRRRKNRLSRKSTQSATELFAALGEPGKPAPAAK